VGKEERERERERGGEQEKERVIKNFFNSNE
jgi:hypothetical protein